MLQSGARELLGDLGSFNEAGYWVPEHRVAWCLRRPIPGEVVVRHLYAPKEQKSHLGGLRVCASVWSCPVCSAKISERRRVELSAGTEAWGGQLVLCTFTLQHTIADELPQLLGDLLTATHKLRTGGFWTRFQVAFGVAGSVRSLENTSGPNGHHPHVHALFFVAGDCDVEAFGRQLRARWREVVAGVGRYASPKWGLDVRYTQADIAAYVAKAGKLSEWTVAHEMTKHPSKRGRNGHYSMLELLELFVVAGDAEAGRRWREFAECFKGKKQLVWSRGLRARLGLVAAEKSDEELATEESEEAVLLAEYSLYQWRVILANDAVAELLDLGDTGDAAAVRAFVGELVELANG